MVRLPFFNRVLTGKYENTEEPMPDARLNRFQGFMSRYLNSDSSKAIKKYAEIAEMVRKLIGSCVGCGRIYENGKLWRRYGGLPSA